MKRIYVQGTAKEILRLLGRGAYSRSREDEIQFIPCEASLCGCRGIGCESVFRGLEFTRAVH